MTDQPGRNPTNPLPVAAIGPDSAISAAALPASPAEAPRQSLSALISFICGVLVCIPWGTGILAVVAGIVGLVRTANPLKKGRWMAVTGLLLGIVSTTLWTIFFGGIALAWLMTPTLKPEEVMTQFSIALSQNDIAKAQKYAPTITNLDELSEMMRRGGTYESCDCTLTPVSKTTCRAAVVVKLDHGTANIDAALRDDSGWKIVDVSVHSRYRTP